MARSTLSRFLRALARWSAIGVAVLVVLELLCHVVLLSNDSLPIDYLPDPYMSYRMMPGSRGNSALGVPFAINSVGIRNPEVVSPKPPGVFRVLVIGDSVTLGYGVPPEVTYSRVLEKMLEGQRIEVINAGSSGHTAQDQLAYLEHYGLALEPDMIVCGFTRGDIGAPLKLQIRGGVGYDSSNLAIVPPAVKKVLRHSRLYFAIARAKWALTDHPRDDSAAARNAAFERDWPTAEITLKRLTTVCEEHHLPLLIAYLPVQVEVARGPEYQVLLDRLSTLGGSSYHFMNVLPLFVAEKDQQGLYLPLDPAHPTALGHGIIAQALFSDPFFRRSLPPGTKFAAQ